MKNSKKLLSLVAAVVLVVLAVFGIIDLDSGDAPALPTTEPTTLATQAPATEALPPDTEAPTEEPTQAPTEEPTEAPTEEPTEETTKPTEKPKPKPKPTEPTDPPAEPTDPPTEPTEPPVSPGTSYTSKEDVALYIHLYGRLPDNFITKSEARALGWRSGSLEPYAPGMCIGGDRFGNREGLLPDAPGRTWTECDIDTLGKKSRGAKRIVFSNDGLIYYTDDHYESFTLLYGEE